MPLQRSLRNAKYDRLGPRRFKLRATVRIFLGYRLPPSHVGCADHPDVEIYTDEEYRTVMEVDAGFVWNGASGPTWDSEGIRRSALIHDALYYMFRRGAIDKRWRKVADRCFYHLLRDAGVNPVRRFYYYWGVRLFGGRAASA